jgi:hypothetical protein
MIDFVDLNSHASIFIYFVFIYTEQKWWIWSVLHYLQQLSAIFWLPVENTGITGKKPQHVYKAVKFLLAQLAKGNVSFSHHLASIICRPLTFHILIFSSETP